MRPIKIEDLLTNYKEMINTLEYDSMRSAGKAKLNSDKLVHLHALVLHYTEKLNSQKVNEIIPKQPTKKKEVANG